MARTARTALVAVAGLILVGSLLTACAAKKATGTGTLGNAPTGSVGVGSPSGGGGGGTGGGSTQGTGGGGGGTGSGGGGTGGGGGGSGSGGGGGHSSPSPPPSPGHTVVGPGYWVTATGDCHWIVDAAHHLSLWAEFTLQYQGPAAADVPFTLVNDKDLLNVSGTKPKPFPVTFNGILNNNIQTFSQSAWPGQTVTMTLTISPTTEDHDASDNVAKVSLQVPDGEPQRDLLNPVPCAAK